ncbi:tRNA (5-methylaminomethyl-2-thiouridine)(34)-methyltransferase MnmD [Roseivirga sp. BDSF3-8]|uniref:tRNA (5-methylaminomethyl-2-thiouridine)(34)-methyltransferase MnmD n=1 Tax=Roseivirga sp. BDSF3-8 TaxID=3241598 RepID=UPI0035323272
MDTIKLIVTDDGSHSLYLPGMNETYHSSHGALAESRHVFIKNGLLPVASRVTQRPIRVLEVGFGTGLNALLARQQAEKLQIPVHFTTLEPFPLPEEIYSQLNYPALLGGSEGLAELFQQMHRAGWNEVTTVSPRFTLQKLKQRLEDFNDEGGYHVVFFDAFAPNKQEEVWDEALIQKVADHMAPGGVLTTYCAQGKFRRSLKAAGLEVESVPGPPGKKEMTCGHKG